MKQLVFLSLLILSLHATAQQPAYKVYAIKFSGTAYPFTVADWVEGAPATEKADINFMVWLIKGGDRNVLVDAGFHRDAEDAKDFQVVDYIRPDSALARSGIHAEQITDIIVSHTHWDHIDGLDLFPNAAIWMQKDDYTYVMSEPWQKDSSSGGYSKRNIRMLLELNLAGRLRLVSGNSEIMPGIKVYTGSRHTFNSQYVVVENTGKKIVIASDNVWLSYQIEHLLPPASGGTFDPSGYLREIKRMKSFVSDNKYILPGHEGKVFARFPKVAEGIVEID